MAGLQTALLRKMRADGSLTDRRVEAAFRAAPRHLFLPGVPHEVAYRDQAVPTKYEAGQAISASSQPAIMAIMLEQLGVRLGQRVLEIGTGTGYNAALLGHLVGPGGQVTTVEIDPELTATAEARLRATGVDNVSIVCGDGGRGYAAGAPYDRILLTVGAGDITPPWLEQLAPGGRMVLPLAIGGGWQKSIGLQAPASANSRGALLESLSLRDCGFMRLRGEFAGADRIVPLGDDTGLSLALRGEPPVSAEVAQAWLSAGGQDQATGFAVSRRDIWQGLGFWLDVHMGDMCEVASEGERGGDAPAPCLVEFEGAHPMGVNPGLIGSGGVCLLWLNTPHEAKARSDSEQGRLMVRSFGPPASALLAERLVTQVGAWHAAGRPTAVGMRLRVFAASPVIEPGPGEILLAKRWTQMLVDWPARWRLN